MKERICQSPSLFKAIKIFYILIQENPKLHIIPLKKFLFISTTTITFSSVIRKFQGSCRQGKAALLSQTAIQMNEMPLREQRFQDHYSSIPSKDFLMLIRSQKLLLLLHSMKSKANTESFSL